MQANPIHIHRPEHKYMQGSPREDTVVIYFTRSAKLEPKQRRFSNSSTHRALFRMMHSNQIATLKASGLPYLLFNECRQQGANLAERLVHAFASAFEAGYSSAIAIGNDCPDLDAFTLQAAARSLRQGNPVLGPDRNGGNYLIGLHRDGYCPLKLNTALQLPGNCHASLCESLPEAMVLRPLADIDSHADLKAWLRSAACSVEKSDLRKAVATLLGLNTPILQVGTVRVERKILRSRGLRAPPLAA
jgi:hypothetical protein